MLYDLGMGIGGAIALLLGWIAVERFICADRRGASCDTCHADCANFISETNSKDHDK